ncbi:MAG: DUF1905 domain-containing protein [Pseudomonadota bacterium]
MIDFRFRGSLWLWSGGAAWHFVTVPEDVSQTIRSFAPDAERGFRSVRVRAAIGDTQWRTSLFPDRKSGCYFLPVKKGVRQSEGMEVGDTVEIALELDA